MMLSEQMGLERLASNIAGRCGHVHRFTGGPNHKHTPERYILSQGPKCDFPCVRFDDVHDDGGNQHDDECHRPELRRCVVDVHWANMPHDEAESEETDDE